MNMTGLCQVYLSHLQHAMDILSEHLKMAAWSRNMWNSESERIENNIARVITRGMADFQSIKSHFGTHNLSY
jgi:hypothetical protein